MESVVQLKKFLGALCLCVMIGMTSVTYAQGGLVTLSLDDGHLSQYVNAFPLLLRHNIRADFAIVTEYMIHRYWGYMTPEQVSELYHAGHGISSHTKDHPDLTALNRRQQRRQIAGSKDDLRQTVADPEILVYPYGQYNAEVQQITLDARYSGARGVSDGYNTPDTDPYALLIKHVDNNIRDDQICSWVNQAPQEGTWLILVFHEVTDERPDYLYRTTPAIFEQGLICIKNSGITAVTLAEGIKAMCSQCGQVHDE